MNQTRWGAVTDRSLVRSGSNQPETSRRTGLLLTALLALVGCGGSEASPAKTQADVTAEVTDDSAVTADAEDDASATDASGPPPACADHVPFVAGTGAALANRTADFTLPTTDGDWTLSTSWNGCESVVFLLHPAGAKGLEAVEAMWQAVDGKFFAALRDKTTPLNAHIVIGTYAQTDTEAAVAALRDKWLAALYTRSAAEQDHWFPRLHFVTIPAQEWPDAARDVLAAKGRLWLAIDRLQRWKEVGLMQLPGQSKGSLALIAHVIRGFAFDRATDLAASAKGLTAVTLFDQIPGGNGWSSPGVYGEATFPTPSEMAKFDSVQLDLALTCKDRDEANCPDWDREAMLYLCSEPAASEPATVAGSCTAGAKQACSCKSNYGSSLVDNSPVVGPGDSAAGERTCAADGSGFGACVCACDTEVYRVITSYKREGRWLTDLSPLLPLLDRGGKLRFRWNTPDNWLVTAMFLLSNQGKPDRAASVIPLFGTEQFDADYNSKFSAKTIATPAAAKRAEVVTILTGHGSGTDTKNCAEFCPHAHYFRVQGPDGKPVVAEKLHPTASSSTGCLDLVYQGVTPNQFGTWPYGRAGWCPGQDVALWRGDVSGALASGSPLLVTYEALLGGQPFVPQWTGMGDYKPVIKLASWLVLYQ